MTVEQRIKEFRRALGLTQMQFAERMGIPVRTLKGYEMGERSPGSEALAAMAKTGVNLNWLLTGSGEMRQTAPSTTTQKPVFTAIQSENTPLQKGEFETSLKQRIAAIEDTISHINDPERRAAALDDISTRAQQLVELAELKQAVEELRSAIKNVRK